MTIAINENVQRIEHKMRILEGKMKAKRYAISVLVQELGTLECEHRALENSLYKELKQN